MKSLLFLWSNDTNCKKSRDSKKDTFHLEEIMSFVKDKIDLAWDLTVLSPARSYFSLAGMSIKYNFAFHVSDDMPKVVIICGGQVLSFIVHYCALLFFERKPFQCGPTFLCVYEMKAPGSRNIVGLDPIWSLVSCMESAFFIHPSLLVLSNVLLSDSHSRMFWAFCSVLIMSNYKSSYWAISCHRLIWPEFRNKGNVDCVYPAWRIFLCSL